MKQSTERIERAQETIPFIVNNTPFFWRDVVAFLVNNRTKLQLNVQKSNNTQPTLHNLSK
jgi:hypothetical protein